MTDFTPKFVACDWMPKDQLLLLSPGIKTQVLSPDGTVVGEFWERKPSAVVLNNVGGLDGNS